MNTTSVAAAAKEIRNALRVKGVTNKQVTVQARNYAGGSAIDIEIKDLAVSYLMVKAIADEHDSVRRDGNGEILSGGNRYVTVRLDDAAISQEALACGGGSCVFRNVRITAEPNACNFGGFDFFVDGQPRPRDTLASAIYSILQGL